MTIIRVTPEILVMTSQHMTQVNGEIQAAVRDLSSVLNGLGGEYGGQLRNQVSSKVGQAQGAASGPTNQVNGLTLELNKRAQLFAAADGQTYAALTGQNVSLRPAAGADLDAWARLQQLSTWLMNKYLQMGTLLNSDEMKWALTAIGTGVIVASLRAGTRYSGEIIINVPKVFSSLKFIGLGPRDLRVLAGLQAGTNHFKASNLPKLLGRAALIVTIATATIEIGAKWIQDFRTYQGSKLASALLVDTALTLAPIGAGLAGAKVGAIIGGTIGSIFPGPGTIIGAAAGALIGGAAASIAADWAIKHYDVRDKSIDAVDSQIMTPIVQRTDEAKKNSVAWVDENILAPTAKKISDSTQSMTSTFSGLVPARLPW